MTITPRAQRAHAPLFESYSFINLYMYCLIEHYSITSNVARPIYFNSKPLQPLSRLSSIFSL